MSQRLLDIRDQMLVENAPDDMLEKQYNKGIELGYEKRDKRDSIWPYIKREWERRLAWKQLQSREPSIVDPDITVESDFDGYFERQVRKWISEHRAAGNLFRHKKMIITAGPYRSSTISMKSNGVDTLTLDFYSASRVGYGGLNADDVADIKAHWL